MSKAIYSFKANGGGCRISGRVIAVDMHDAQNKTNPQSPPSLMVQIETAPDLTTLDALEIDVSARHPDIQPKLMGYVRKRRAELEN